MAYPIFKYLLFLQSSTNTTEIFKPCDIVCYMRYYKGHSMTLGMTLFHSPLPLKTPPIPNSITILSFHLIFVNLKSNYMQNTNHIDIIHTYAFIVTCTCKFKWNINNKEPLYVQGNEYSLSIIKHSQAQIRIIKLFNKFIFLHFKSILSQIFS